MSCDNQNLEKWQPSPAPMINTFTAPKHVLHAKRRLRENRRDSLEKNEAGSLEYFLANNLLNYTDEERSRVKIINVSILPALTDLVPVEPMFQFMNRFVLAPDWFKYINGIAKTSLQQPRTELCCIWTY